MLALYKYGLWSIPNPQSYKSLQVLQLDHFAERVNMRYIAITCVFLFLSAWTPAQDEFPSLTNVQWITSPPAEGKLQLVEFWATWCPSCRTSIPHLNEIHARYKARGLVVIGISDETEESIKWFMENEVAMDYAVGYDPKNALGYQLNIAQIPTAFFVEGSSILWRGHPMDIDDKLVEEMFAFADAQQFPSLEHVTWITEPPTGGKIRLVEFWATWCPPCRESIPHLNEIHQKFGSTELVVIGISKESEQTIRDFMAETAMEYTIGSDPSGALASALAIEGIPTAFFVKQGKIVWRGHPMEITEELIRGFGIRPAGEKDQYDLIVEKFFGIIEEFVNTLATIQDVESARNARPALQALVDEMKNLEKEVESVPNPSPEREALLMEQYEARLNEAYGRFREELMRINLDPQLSEEIADILQQIR